MRRIVLAVLCSLFPILVSAQTSTITSIDPASGPTAGGTTVTIRGSGFLVFGICPILCFPAHIDFGTVSTFDFTIVDDTTIIAVTPPHTAGVVDVRFFKADLDPPGVLPSGFQFTDGSEIPTLDLTGKVLLSFGLLMIGFLALSRTGRF